MKIRWLYVFLFTLAICGAVYFSLPSQDTLVEMSRDDGNIDRTVQLLQVRANQDPTNLKVALDLIAAYQQKNDADGALKAVLAAYAYHPDDIRLQKALAEALVDKGDVEQALAVLPKVGRDREFLLRVSSHYEARGDLKEAEKYLLPAEPSGPGRVAAWLTVAGWRGDLYNLPGEAEALKEALKLDPENAVAWERYFRNSAWRLDADAALEAATHLEKLHPLDRSRLELVRDFQLAKHDSAGVALTLEKIAALPEATADDAIEYALALARSGDEAGANRRLMQLLAAPGVPGKDIDAAVNALRDSAERTRDLDLAFRLVRLAKTPEELRSSRMVAVNMAIEQGRLGEARDFFKPVLDDPEAPSEVLAMGFELAYLQGDYAAMPPLLERLERAGTPIDDVIYTTLENDKTLEVWRGDARDRPQSVAALAGLARAAAKEGSIRETARAVDTALPLLDSRDTIDGFAIFESLVYLGANETGSQTVRDERMRQAEVLADRLVDGPLAKSRWFMLMAADVNERRGRAETAERFWNAVAALYPSDAVSRMGIARSAAARGDERSVEDVLRRFAASTDKPEAEEVRSMIYACLGLSDFFEPFDPAKAASWLERAKRLTSDNRETLVGDDLENVRLLADVAERSGDWNNALAGWRAVGEKEPGNPSAWLGQARAAIALGDADSAWDALSKADSLVAQADMDQRLQLAWQFLAVADATPETSPAFAERKARAGAFAEACLERRWEPELAASLIWRAMADDDLDKARSLLARSENAPPELHATLAEALLAKKLPDAARDEALLAAASDDRSVLLRMANVLSQTGDKEKTRELLVRLEKSPGDETPEFLLEMSYLYGGLEDREKEFAFAEKRARMGGEPEWVDAVDRHIWGDDAAGALALLAEAERLYPDSIELLERKLTILADNNRPGEVANAFERAKEVNPGIEEKLSAEALAALGVAYDDIRSTPRARRYFRLALEREPANKRGSMGFARLLRRDGNLGGAIRQLRIYVQAHADDAWGWLELANTRTAADQNGRSEYRRVIELTEPDAKGDTPRDVRAARAVALRALDREKEALALLKSTMGPTIDNPDIACDYAQMLMEIKKYDEAEKILRETVKVFPHHVWAYRLEATILVRRQKYDLAVERLKEALLWAPNDGEVQRDLGFAAQLWERNWDSQKGWLTAGGR